jgi:penicillin-binding protein 2
MFERRLKIFLAILVCVTFVLVLRAGQVQVLQKEEWRRKALDVQTGSRTVETTRGNILDRKGRLIAVDRPCIDVCVDFRALSRPGDDEGAKARAKWVENVAVERLKTRLREEYTGAPKAKRKELLAAEIARVEADIQSMWGRLAELSGRPPESIEEARSEIVKKVDMRRRSVWYRNYQTAMKKYEEREPAPAWRRWLIDPTADAPTEDQFTKLTVAEELTAHPILKAVKDEIQNELRKHIEDYPGLVLRPGVQRYYPDDCGEVACHLIGQLARVTRKDLDADPNVGKDELRQYYPNDLIGRTGLEMLAEPMLRGSRGRIETIDGNKEVGRVQYTPGKDVHTSIDIDLQREIVAMFKTAEVLNETTKEYETMPMHGGAVVIDVATGEVLALASYPTFNLGTFEEDYSKLVDDDLNFPMLNRATQVARVPGSTAKPMVGLSAINEGVVGVHEGVECTGYFVLNGRRMPTGRCWTMSMFGERGDAAAHHQIPYNDPHIGSFGNPDGFLIYTDAVQRSCNVYFENMGERLKLDGLSKWYRAFGLGQRTGLGIPESTGSVPDSFKGPAHEARFASWIAAIGQGTTTATPIQMANVCATIARGGTWMRPRLIPDTEGVPAPPGARPTTDLKLSRESVAAAHDGMTRVVNTPAGSAFKFVMRKDLLIAGKTGTAEESSPLKVRVRDAKGKVVYKPLSEEEAKLAQEEQEKLKRHPMMRLVKTSSALGVNPEAPWYRGWGEDGTKLKHSWFIGFAPADHPKVAFAVMLEYGGSGGGGAGKIASRIVQSLVNHQYLKTNPNAVAPEAQPATFEEPAHTHEHSGD